MSNDVGGGRTEISAGEYTIAGRSTNSYSFWWPGPGSNSFKNYFNVLTTVESPASRDG